MTEVTAAPPDLLTVAQVAERGKLTPETVRLEVKRGNLVGEKRSHGYVFTPAAVDAWLASPGMQRWYAILARHPIPAGK